MPVDLSDALLQHGLGHLDRAAQDYQAALDEDPDRPDALYLLGLVALQRGDPSRAFTLMGKAVAFRPEEADYHAGLAEVHRALGQFDHAVACCREAARLRPDSPEHLGNLGAILVDRGEVDAAVGCFREALRLRPEFVAAHNNLGNALLIQGDATAALDHFRIAARLDPESGEPHLNLGAILMGRGELKESLVHCREAVRLRPDLLAARIHLGNVLLMLGRLDEAEACFREVIRLRPDLAAAHANLAGILEQRGDFEQAMESLRATLRHAPRHAGALALLATRLRGKLPDADRAVIEGLLADPGLPPDQRWPLQFGLGQVLDAQGEFERAAGVAAEANALQRADLNRRGLGYDPGAFKAFVDPLLSSFTPAFFAKVRGWGLESDRPVFVVGLPRSGTTLIEQILASHPRVFGAGELRLAKQTFKAMTEATGRAGNLQECLDGLGRDALNLLARRHLDKLAALNGSADRIVDKMPENYLYLGLIAALFPNAKLIHCRRDLRDTAVSCWMTNFGQVRWACDLEHIAARAAEYRRVMDHWRRALPTPIFEVDYEAVVADLEATSRTLVDWCGLEWNPACLDFHTTRRSVQTVSVAQVRLPIYHSSVGRWKNYEPSLSSLFAKLYCDE
ncbi:tetratricopeptide repeat-containing sulfotransferase family protein [Paludisphaera borealis]|uniref:TPR repeat-containing protein YrrB n=1 Tax=Paludisphaera borealis TaxID=1387353 RepID=A0A1U7CTX4_9BACT|nr:tetratricopeptide repeat-containing sulfotransferase family protein [Paludisphaera borealis]APW62385.1 TPR repeat-containing protein YrrB [Paludisphaera borealis]